MVGLGYVQGTSPCWPAPLEMPALLPLPYGPSVGRSWCPAGGLPGPAPQRPPQLARPPCIAPRDTQGPCPRVLVKGGFWLWVFKGAGPEE